MGMDRIKIQSADFFRAAKPIARLADIFQAEQLRWFLFLPVCLGSGISLYFALATEPPVWMAVAAILLPLAIFYISGRLLGFDHLVMPVAMGAIAIGAGFALAYHRAHQVSAPIL